MVRVDWRVLSTLVLLVSLVFGCNVYEGLYEEGDSDNPEELLQDARIALQQDRPSDAVLHLRKALPLTSENDLLHKRIQIKLASAVLQVQGINMMTLTHIARNLTGESTTEAVIAPAKSMGQTCLFPASHARVSFDPLEDIDYELLSSEASEDALEESRDLIARVFSGNETGNEPAFPCEEAALDQAILDLQNQGLSDEEVVEAMMDYAVALSTVAYLDVVDAGEDDAQFFYVTPPAGDQYIGLCFSSEQTCNNSVGKVNEHLNGLDCSTRILQKRAELLASTSAQDLADLAREGFQYMATGLSNATCIVQ
ncbi:MAG: hypothetical protein ACE5G0_04480 [Rhodothermales bacterium]